MWTMERLLYFGSCFSFRNGSLVRLSYSLGAPLSAVPSHWDPLGRTHSCEGAVCPQVAKSATHPVGCWQPGHLTHGLQTPCSRNHYEQKVSTHRVVIRWRSVTVMCCFFLSRLLLGKAEISLMRVGNQELPLGGSGRIQAGKRFQQGKHITFYQSLLIWEQACLFFPQLSVERQNPCFSS